MAASGGRPSPPGHVGVAFYVRRGSICIAVSCADRFAGDFISSDIDPAGGAHAVWVRDAPEFAVRYARIV